MSTFARITRHPESGLYELATHHDNYFGPHTYGVEFPSNGKVYPLDLVEKKQIYDFWKDDVLAAFKVLPPNSTEVEFLNEVERQYKARWKRDPLSGEGAAVKSATIPHKAPDEGSMPSHNCGLTGHIPAGSPTTSPSSPKTDAVTSGPGTGEGDAEGPKLDTRQPELERLIADLKACNSGDEEVDHSKADSLLINYINDPRVTEAYDAIDKWYA